MARACLSGIRSFSPKTPAIWPLHRPSDAQWARFAPGIPSSRHSTPKRLDRQYPSRPAPAHRSPTIIVRSALGRGFVGSPAWQCGSSGCPHDRMGNSEGYRGTPLRLRVNVIARLIRPQPERASLACPAVEPNTRAGLFLWWPSEAQGRPLTGIAIGSAMRNVAGTLKASQATRRIGSIRRRPAFIGYEANGHIGNRP